MRFTFGVLLSACSANQMKIQSEPTSEISIEEIDADGDGFFAEEDCDDESPDISPSAEEICDGVDNNCNNEVDENVGITYYLDEDGDGFGDPEQEKESCTQPEGYVVTGTDCDDSDVQVYPSAQEICDDIDNDCDQEIDEDSQTILYQDLDGDGFGIQSVSIRDCQEREGFVLNYGDCDDEDEDIHPDQIEICDGLDNNCDGDIDENLLQEFYLDQDNDGYGGDSIILVCELESGLTTISGDCNDNDSEINPDSIEYCDLIDNNCNEDIDENALDKDFFYEDSDADGYGNPDVWVQSCNSPNEYVSDNTDCDDNNDQLISQLEDNDCDGVLGIDDCNDNDETTILDMDCDGIVAVDENNETLDCDDFDPEIGDINNDNDCDGLIATDESGVEIDCDDNYPSANDLDCDYVLYSDESGSQLDCDDTDPTLGNINNDLD